MNVICLSIKNENGESDLVFYSLRLLFVASEVHFKSFQVPSFVYTYLDRLIPPKLFRKTTKYHGIRRTANFLIVITLDETTP